MKIVAWITEFTSKLEDFLSRHVSLMIAIAAVVVSYSQLRQAKIQNILMLAEISPQFILKSEPRLDKAKMEFIEEEITIENEGGTAYNVSVNVQTYLIIDYDDFVLNLRLINYYSNTIHTQEGRGRIALITGPGNLAKIRDLSNSYRELASLDDAFGYIEVERFVRLRYDDVIQNHSEKYYEVETVFGARQINSEIGSKLVRAIYSKRRDNTIDLFDVTAAHLIKLVEEARAAK